MIRWWLILGKTRFKIRDIASASLTARQLLPVKFDYKHFFKWTRVLIITINQIDFFKTDMN